MCSPQELGVPCISDTHTPFTINRAAHDFLALLQSSPGELSGLPTALQNSLGIACPPLPGGEGWVTVGLRGAACCRGFGDCIPCSLHVFLEDTQDSLLGVLSCFRDGCKALPVLPVLSSCLSPACPLPARPLPHSRGAGYRSPGELLCCSWGLASTWTPCSVSRSHYHPHRVLPVPSLLLVSSCLCGSHLSCSSRLSCSMAVGFAARISPTGPSAAAKCSCKGGVCLVVTQLCAPLLRWSPWRPVQVLSMGLCTETHACPCL